MKKIFTILLFLISLAGFSQTQVSIQYPDTSLVLPVASINLNACVSLCGTNMTASGWKQVSGTPITFSTTVGLATVISNFSTGIVKIEFAVSTDKGTRLADTLTLTFTTPPNKPPVAVVPKDTTINLPYTNFILDGSKSSDPDGQIVSYKWSGTGVVNMAGGYAYIASPIVGKTTYTLAVIDNGGSTATAVFNLTVNAAPVVKPRTVIRVDFTTRVVTYDDGTTSVF
jgi:hypothetical protein